MSMRMAVFGEESVKVFERQKKFRFGNGETKRAESYVELPQVINGEQIHLGIHALDAPGVPLLLSVQTLRKLKAVIDFEAGTMCVRKVGEDAWITLKRGSNGHLLLDLTQDWFRSSAMHVGDFHPNFGNDHPSASTYEDAADADGFVLQEPRFPSSLSHSGHELCEQQDEEEELIPESAMNDKQNSSHQNTTKSSSIQGSNMHCVLPLLALSVVTQSQHGDPVRQCWLPGKGKRFKCGCSPESHRHVQGEEEDQSIPQGSHSFDREVRLQPGHGPGPTGWPNSRVPAFRQPSTNAGRSWKFERSKQIRPLDGLQHLQIADRIHPDLRVDWHISPGGSSSGRRQDGDGTSQGHREGRTCIPGEAQQQDMQCDWSRASFERQIEEAGERQGEDSCAREAWRCEDDRSSECRAEEGHEEGECNQCGAEGGISMGRGGSVRSGSLSEERKMFLQEKMEDFIFEATQCYDDLQVGPQRVELMEICCPTDSRLSETFLQKHHGALRIGLPAFDLSTKKGLEEAKKMMIKNRPRLAWFSLPCGPYSPIQTLFNENTEEKWMRSQDRKKKSRRLIYNGLELAELQLELGGELAWEWPWSNLGWKLRRVQAFFEKLRAAGRLHVARVDGCAYGLKNSKGEYLRKPWRISTAAAPLANVLERRCPRGHHHGECLGGKEARDSGFYPQAMCDVIQKVVHEMFSQVDQSVFPSLYPVFETDPLRDDVAKETIQPLDEKEKKMALRMLEKLHRKTGHPSNAALSQCLKNRGAHPEVVKLALKHQCPECQELRAAPLNPSTALQKSEMLWETVVMDNAEFTVGNTTYHVMVMVDEASRLMCAHFLFSHSKEESRNATAEEVVNGLNETWVRHYGMPAKVRLDPEGAFRSTLFGSWCEERGIEVFPCAAEAHEQIGVVERSIQTLKSTVRQLLQEGGFDPWQAVIQACQTHNEFERVQGFSPYQWAFGRQPTLVGRFHEGGYDDPWWTSSAVPGSSMAANLKLRVRAQQAFLRYQSQEICTRAANAKTRRHQVFLPGDLVFFKRVKPPAQPQAQVRLAHKLWRWYGPARVLASETRTDAQGMERKPTHIVWIVSHGRLKRCAPDQLRHASSREQAIAEGLEAPTTSWTFHGLTKTLFKGEFEILDQNVFPDDEEAKAPPRNPRRSRSLSRNPVTPVSKVPRSSSVPRSEVGRRSLLEDKRPVKEGQDGNKTLQKQVTEHGGERAHQRAMTSKQESQQKEEPSSSAARSRTPARDTTQGVDINRYLNDPRYDPEPQAVHQTREVGELFEQPLFKKQRQNLAEEEDVNLFATSFFNAAEELKCEGLVCTIELGLPSNSSEWRRLKRSPEAYYVKKVKGAEVRWHSLNDEERSKFEKAKEAEISQWLTAAAVRRALGPVPKGRQVQMRGVLTYKDTGAPKARIVLIGYQDPDLESIQSAAPTMSRRSRQLALQYASTRSWRTLKADVKAAFLQGESTEENRQLYATPLPELQKALGCKPGEAVQVLKSCYGLVSAPASWFQCVRKCLADLNFTQSKTDPCLWFLYGDPDEHGDKETLGYICSHVDDFLIAGCEQDERWILALESFYGRFRFSPWECQNYNHCGIRIREEMDFSFTLDHSTFVEGIEQIDYKSRPDYELITEDERTQLRGVLGALQWRSHQSTPMIAAKLGQLQSDITKATVETLKKANRLAREAFQDRFVSTRINQLGVASPKEVHFVAWSDAALANRKDLSSTGGFVIAATTPGMIQGETSPLSLMAWRSAKLQRKARSSLAAEAQALADTDQELMYLRLAWSEFCGYDVDLKEPAKSAKRVPGTLVVDAKALYDVLQKKDLNSAGGGLKDKFSSLEVLCLLESIESHNTLVRWVHSEAQLADAMTKPLPQGVLQKVMIEGKWKLTYDPEFVSAKRLKKRRCTESNICTTGNSFGACEL